MLARRSRRLLVLATTLLLVLVVLLACNLSFNTSATGGCHDDLPTPPSIPTATLGQRFRVGQQINVNNMYVVSLDSAKLTTLTTYSEKGTPFVSGPVLEVQLSKIDLHAASSSDFASEFTLSSPTGQNYSEVSSESSQQSSCGGPEHAMFDIMFTVPPAAHDFVLMVSVFVMVSTNVNSLESLVWDISA